MAQIKGKSEEYLMLGGINTKASEYATGPHEFLDLQNYNFSKPGALTKREGSTLYVGATVVGRITGLYEFERLNGSSYLIATANTNAYTVTSSAYTVFKSGLTSGSNWDFQTFVDRLFAVSGADAFKYDGTNNPTNLFLPYGVSGFGVTAVVGGGLSGVFLASYGYFNDRSYYGPAARGITISLNGSTFGSIEFYGLTTPPGYGVSGYAFYRSQAESINMFQAATSGATTNYTLSGTTTLTSIAAPAYLWLTQIPKYISLFSNQMIYSGFSGALSTFYISDIGEPEGIPPENVVEVRTNDGDKIMATQAYSGTLLVFKERSMHRLTGDNPNNFALQEITDQYGCLSNRAVVQYKDVLLFLDRKGVIQFNGANIEVLSDKVEPYFIRMNVSAAKETATAVHDRLKNQLKFSFPIDASTVNNITLVYDYMTQAWTTEKGYNPAITTMAKRELSAPTVFYGGYTGTIHNFGASLLGDNGNGMTCLIKTRFLADMGNSIEKQMRRVYLDCATVGPSSLINVNFYQDYGASIVLTRSMYQNPFQSRIDFGIMCKSMALEFTHGSTGEPSQINGYTVEYRMQRRV